MTAEQIVRALAAVDPGPDAQGCRFCEGWVGRGYAWHPPTPHDADCPWRLAVEWVAAQDAPRS